MTNEPATGYVACDYTSGDLLVDVRHGEIRDTAAEAQIDYRAGHYEGVRYVHSDGYLYVDAPADEANAITDQTL